MEIYDTANKLAEEIKKSKQYLNLKKSKELLMADSEKKQMIILEVKEHIKKLRKVLLI